MSNDYSHYIVATTIISRNDRFLIVKRSKNESFMSGMWSFPGGKLEASEYVTRPKSTPYHWHNILDHLLMRECKEEVGLNIKNIKYIRNLAFLRPDKTPTVVLSFAADYHSGKVKLNKELDDFAWVTVHESKNYELIHGLYEEILAADRIKKR